jgi:hypothetical protein
MIELQCLYTFLSIYSDGNAEMKILVKANVNM